MPRVFPRWLFRFFRDDQHRYDLAFFRSVSIFQGLSHRQLGRLIQVAQRRSYQAGEKLFDEGQVGRALFIIKSGQVALTRQSAAGKPRLLGTLNRGQIFGEMALIENQPRTATAVVKEEADIYLLYSATVDTLIQRHPDIGLKLLRNLSRLLSVLLRRTNERIDVKKRGAA